MDAQNKSGFDNGTTLMFQGIGVYLHRYGQTDGCTVSHMTTKLVIDGLPDFLGYGAPFICLWHAAALL